MPGSNFDSPLQTPSGKIEPTGDLFLSTGEKLEHLYFWVMQLHDTGRGALCVGEGHDTGSGKWTSNSPYCSGDFVKGQALAMAVQTSKPNGGGEPAVFVWSETITLT